jgi:hypothetical protein
MNEFKEPRVGSTIMRVLEGKAYITVTFEETDAFKNRASGSHIRKVDTCGFICRHPLLPLQGGGIILSVMMYPHICLNNPALGYSTIPQALEKGLQFHMRGAIGQTLGSQVEASGSK